MLDLDGYSQGLQDFNDVVANIDRAHEEIQDLFEKSITEKLRGVMNAQ